MSVCILPHSPGWSGNIWLMAVRMVSDVCHWLQDKLMLCAGLTVMSSTSQFLSNATGVSSLSASLQRIRGWGYMEESPSLPLCSTLCAPLYSTLSASMLLVCCTTECSGPLLEHLSDSLIPILVVRVCACQNVIGERRKAWSPRSILLCVCCKRVCRLCAGRVLNRFSKDIGFLDDLLPHTFLEYLFVSSLICTLSISELLVTVNWQFCF